MIRKLLSGVPFVLLNLMAPEGGAGGGGGADQPPVSPFSGSEAPAIAGDSLENKVTSAGGIIKNLFQSGKDLLSRLSTAINDRDRLQQQFDAVTSDLKTEKEGHITTKGELSSSKTTVTGLTTERDNANKNVERLEKLCSLRGIDHSQVVLASNTPEGTGNSPASKWEKYQQLREDEGKGKENPGTASAYYKANEKDLRTYAATQR